MRHSRSGNSKQSSKTLNASECWARAPSPRSFPLEPFQLTKSEADVGIQEGERDAGIGGKPARWGREEGTKKHLTTRHLYAVHVNEPEGALCAHATLWKPPFSSCCRNVTTAFRSSGMLPKTVCKIARMLVSRRSVTRSGRGGGAWNGGSLCLLTLVGVCKACNRGRTNRR